MKVDNFKFEKIVSSSLVMLSSGRLLNLGCDTGHLSFEMSCTFTVQVLSQLDLLRKVTSIKAFKNDFQLLPKDLDAGALDGEEPLPIKLLEFGTNPAGALSRAQVARELPPSPQGRLRHQRPRSAGYDCVNNATVREGRV